MERPQDARLLSRVALLAVDRALPESSGRDKHASVGVPLESKRLVGATEVRLLQLEHKLAGAITLTVVAVDQ